VERFETHGYLVLRNFLREEFVETIKQVSTKLVSDSQAPSEFFQFCNLLELFPAQMLQCVLDKALLELAEGIMGPFVQVDSVCLVGSNSKDERMVGRPVQWHRDRFAVFPNGQYVTPRVLLVLVYLQTVDEKVGPLRVIPGSHRSPVTLTDMELTCPHAEEELLFLAKGDAVVLHHSILHSGTHNVSAEPRTILGIAYNYSFMRQQDDFSGSICSTLRERALATSDFRLMRLLGKDVQLETRWNTGITVPERELWEQWLKEDGEIRNYSQTLSDYWE
jgi:ectoine hydroxylase-related dioxygenase (phytanoyl-CoA dioxygenase family)